MEGYAPILVVEDNENDVILIRRTLTNSCIPNPRHFVKTGEEAIDYLVGMGPYSDREKYPLPALVLLDLKLPGMDGFQVIQWIREHCYFSDLRVVVLTSSNKLRDLRKAYSIGANSFLVKPLEFENVRALFSAIGAQLWDRETASVREQMPARTSNAGGDYSSELR
jgi:CheY-like chemotaxis protein